MSVDGIWKIEFLQSYGWEAVSTAFLENGRYLAASQDHYTIGRYEVSENNIKIVATIYLHGEMLDPSELHLARQFDFEGQIKDDHITGQADDSETQRSMTIRATRLGYLP